MNKTLKYIFITGFSAWFVFSMVNFAVAQNFGNVGSPQPQVQQEQPELTEQDIEQMLINEGIPLTPIFSGSDVVSSSKYTLGVDDVISIAVTRHPEVSGQFQINNEGKIQYGFVGDVLISGLKKKEVEELLTDILSKYIIEPEVLIIITGFNSKIVYVIGEVGRPGKIAMRGDTITIREALVQAALPQLSAKAKKSLLITPSDDGHPKHTKVNVYDLLYKGDLRENLVMKPGDVLYIPPTFLTKTMRAIQPVSAPIGAAAGTGRTVTTGF